MPGRNGGTLKRGNTGNKGGTGRPANEVRERLLESVRTHSPGVVDDIASGKPVQRARLRVADLVPFVTCANCGEHEIKANDLDAMVAEVDVEISASPRDRIAALEFASKYGLGPVKEVSVDSVRERVTDTLDIIQRHVSPEQYAAIVHDIEPVWQ